MSLVYCIICQDIANNTIRLLDISENYSESLIKFTDFYKDYIEDDSFIVRQVRDKNTVIIFKRIYGTLWNSKKEAFRFSIHTHDVTKKYI